MGAVFEVFIQFGAAVAVVVYYRQNLALAFDQSTLGARHQALLAVDISRVDSGRCGRVHFRRANCDIAILSRRRRGFFDLWRRGILAG